LLSVSGNYGSWSTTDLDRNGTQSLGFFQLAYGVENWGVTLTGIFANTSYKADENIDPFEISTFSDTDISTYFQRKFRNVTIRGGVDLILPTGQSAFSEDDLGRMLTDDLSLDLMILNSYGGGLNIAPHLVTAFKFGDVVIGFGFRYEYTGVYESVTDTSSQYNPGDRILGLVNAAWTISGNSYILSTLSYTYLGTDQKDDADIFREGDKVSLEVRYIRKWDDALNTVLSVRATTQQQNESLGEDDIIITEVSNSNNNVYEVFLNSIYRRSRGLSIIGLVGYKYVQSNGYAEDDSLYDAGRAKIYVEPGVTWYFSRRMYTSLKFRYSIIKDKADTSSSEDASYNVFNTDIGMVYRF